MKVRDGHLVVRQGVLPRLHSGTFYVFKKVNQRSHGRWGEGEVVDQRLLPTYRLLPHHQVSYKRNLYMYEGLEIRHALYLTPSLSTIIVARFLLVIKSIDNNI